MAKKDEVKSASQMTSEDVAAAQEVATTGGEVAVVEGMEEWEGASNTGLEKATAKDQLIPRLTILQGLSPQLKSNKAQFIPGAKEGDVADVAMGEIFDLPVMFLPCVFDKVWIEWAPRSTGGGLVFIHITDNIMAQTQLNEKKQNVLPSGNIVQETAQWYGLNLSAGARPCFIPFVSTQLKKSRRWVTLAQGEKVKRKDGSEFTPPLFFRVYALNSIAESNTQGDWFGWVIDRGPMLVEYGLNWRSILDTAKTFQEQVLRGLLTADTASMAEDGGGPIIDGSPEARM